MEITNVRVSDTKEYSDPSDRLLAFSSITFDKCFVVHDLKVIDGNKGVFVAMPTRRLTGKCNNCGSKNHLLANYCNFCGRGLPKDNIELDENNRAKLYVDVCHPIVTSCRNNIQTEVLKAYHSQRVISPNFSQTSTFCVSGAKPA